MKTRLLLLTAFAIGCAKQPAQDTTQTAGKSTPAEPSPSVDAVAENSSEAAGDPHVVVFADRTSQAYLLLRPPGERAVPTREGLANLVKAKLATAGDEPELALLLELIATEPKQDPRALEADGSPRATRDLLGLDLDILPISGSKGAVGDATLTDPVLTRLLTDDERANLVGRNEALLLRAEYRNQFAVRGLRLLQTLTRVVALDEDALIHDPDTGETMGVRAFSDRRLKSSLANVAQQIAVVPFPDRMFPDAIRLTTRGMRRFGSPDLELDGLPRDPKVLQRATDLLNGLALQMVLLGEFDSTGYAVELAQTVTVGVDDVISAYGSNASHVPDCGEACPGEVDVHLVERTPEDHDPTDHMVVRVIAPREVSDSVDYDHPKWVRAMLSDVFG